MVLVYVLWKNWPAVQDTLEARRTRRQAAQVPLLRSDEASRGVSKCRWPRAKPRRSTQTNGEHPLRSRLRPSRARAPRYRNSGRSHGRNDPVLAERRAADAPLPAENQAAASMVLAR